MTGPATSAPAADPRIAPTVLITQAEFAQAMAASFGTRVRLRIPAWPLRHLAGEMATLLLAGQNVRPQQALAAGYQYRFATLPEAFADLRGWPASAWSDICKRQGKRTLECPAVLACRGAYESVISSWTSR